MKERIVVMLFALPFAGVGLGVLAMSVIPTLYDWHRMQSWDSTEARLTHAKLVRNSGDSTTYRSEVAYQYRYQGKLHYGDRAAINTSSDNIGKFQQKLGNKLVRDFKRNNSISIWVNPDSPGESIINRELRWGLLLFKMVFVILFGGVGVTILYFSFAAKEKNQQDEEPAPDPESWRLEERWQNNQVRSTSRVGNQSLWAIAIFWNLVSSPIFFVLPEEIQQGNYAAFIGLVFPIAGAWLIYTALRQTLEWRRFGPTPLEMRPFPARLGDEFTGYIDIDLPYDPGVQFKLMLSCIYAYDTDDGERERLKWQDTTTVSAQPGMNGTRVKVKFSVPGDLPESSIMQENYHKWVLDVEAELEGVNYSRQFEIPVFGRSENTDASLSSGKTTIHDDSNYRESSTDADVESLLAVRHAPGGFTWHYPAFRYPVMGIFLFFFAILCCASSTFIAISMLHEMPGDSFFSIAVSLFQNTIAFIMTSIFALVGLVLLVVAGYILGNSLTLVLKDATLYFQRKVFGVPLPLTTIRADQVREIKKKINFTTSSGKQHKVNYRIFLITNLRKEYTLAENIHSAREADAVCEYFRQKFNYE